MRSEQKMPSKKAATKTMTNAGLRLQKGMPVSDIVQLLPECEPLLAEYGLHCFHCAANTIETLEEGCRGHGFTDEDIDELITDLNDMLQEKPARPQLIDVTLPAAQALKKILEEETEKNRVLLVTLDERGGFCMEFRKAEDGMLLFTHPEEPDVRIAAQPLTLARIGGAKIDFRDGRFKLDLPTGQAGMPDHDNGTMNKEKMM